MTADGLFLLSYLGAFPEVMGAARAALPGHAVIGQVRLGAGAWLGAGATIRADGNYIHIGNGFHMGRNSTIHISHDIYPTVMGNNVVIGGNVVIHASTLQDDVVAEDDTVILDGSTIEAGVVVEAGSVVYPRSTLKAGMLYAGRPAKPVRPLEPGEFATRAMAQVQRNTAASAGWVNQPEAAEATPTSFVAETAFLKGNVQLATDASIWYGCSVDAADQKIQLGERCNVQDNSVLVAKTSGIVMGPDSTLGHNVYLEDSQVGARCLVGMGSRIAAGTVIADDTFIAAGSQTAPGQKLEGGTVWGGNPARPIGTLDDAKKAIILMTSKVYVLYANTLNQQRGKG